MLTEEIQVPLAGWGKRIFFPKMLAESLTQEEFEAVVAHELEHHRWNDTILRALCYGTAALFWWVPMRSWLRKLEQEQEFACDASVYKYGLDGLVLASALQKTILKKQEARYYPCAAFRSIDARPLLERLRAVLFPKEKQNKWAMAAALSLLLGILPLLGFAIC